MTISHFVSCRIDLRSDGIQKMRSLLSFWIRIAGRMTRLRRRASRRPGRGPVRARPQSRGAREEEYERAVRAARQTRTVNPKRYCRSAAAFVRMAMIRIMLRRLAAKPSA